MKKITFIANEKQAKFIENKQEETGLSASDICRLGLVELMNRTEGVET